MLSKTNKDIQHTTWNVTWDSTRVAARNVTWDATRAVVWFVLQDITWDSTRAAIRDAVNRELTDVE